MSRYRRPNREFQRVCDLAHRRVVAVLHCIDVLLPSLDPRRKKRLANKILTLCDGKDRSVKITQAQLEQMVWGQVQCLNQRAGRCPMLLFSEPLCRELNAYFNED